MGVVTKTSLCAHIQPRTGREVLNRGPPTLHPGNEYKVWELHVRNRAVTVPLLPSYVDDRPPWIRTNILKKTVTQRKTYSVARKVIRSVQYKQLLAVSPAR